MTQQLEATHSGKMKERFDEIQTRLRRQMVMAPKPLVLAGTLPFSNSPMLSTVKIPLPTPTSTHLLLAVASVGITWASASWWKQRRIRNTAAQ